MAEENNNDEKPLVERWLEDQQEWQKTMLRYMDSMASDENFLVHLGNAMRGSLLAGKPYPGTAKPTSEPDDDEHVPADDGRLDRILFTLHEIQGQLNDLHLTVERLAAAIDRAPSGVGSAVADVERDAEVSVEEPDRALRSRKSRSRKPAAGRTKLRRSQPRSAFGRRGDSD